MQIPDWDLYEFFQKAIDTFYLLPFPQKDRIRQKTIVVHKKSLRDGHIERLLHGAEHVGRACILPLVLIDLFRQCFPQYTSESIQALSETLLIEQSLLIKLIRASVIYHDSAREDEAEDRWDKQSGVNLKLALLNSGFPESIADFFESATANKDHITEFEKYCQNALPSLPVIYAHFVRKIINLSDCLDTMHCRGEFNFSFVIRQLSDIPGYSEHQHLPLFIKLGQQLHTVIWDQGDMYFDCKLILGNQTISTERTGQHFIRSLKVQFEHAPDVVSVLTAHMKSYLYFADFLNEEVPRCTDFAKAELAFDPFIHGTQSGVLPILKLMKERGLSPELTSPLQLLSQGLAPFTGELSRHGASRKFTDSSLLCFGRLRLCTDDKTQYDLRNILEYASKDAGEITEDNLINNTIKLVKSYYKLCIDSGFTYLHTFLVYYTRAKLLGIADSALFEADEKNRFFELYKATIQFFYLFLLLHQYLRVNSNVCYTTKGNPQIVSDLIYESLTMSHFINKIREYHFDIKEIYSNPTRESVYPLLLLFILPNHYDYMYGNWLDVKMDPLDPIEIHCDYSKDFTMLASNDSQESINWYLLEYFRRFPDCQFLVATQIFTLKHIEHMEKNVDLLVNVFNTQHPTILNDQLTNRLLTTNFPIILLSQNDEAITISRFSTQEFRANKPLVFGQDIRLIATNTLDNAMTLRAFLVNSGFEHVGILLFSELQKCVNNTISPKVFHIDRKRPLPTLAWMSAKAVVPGTIQKNNRKSILILLEEKMQKAEKKYQDSKRCSNSDLIRVLHDEYIKAKETYDRVSDDFCFHLAEAEFDGSTFKQ